MERALFASRFRVAAERSRDFAREYIEEQLPDALRFRVQLNASYDGNPLREDERLYPQDSGLEVARRLRCCTAEEVVDVLWRHGAAPEWVNLTVLGEMGDATLVEVLSCGRFTSNDGLLYHRPEGRPPFHVLGPKLPVGHGAGHKFSIYHDSGCWTRDELHRVAQHAPKVWSLELFGADLDDDTVVALPVFQRLEVLELWGSPLRGSGLSTLNRQERLRVLRIHLQHDRPFSVEHLPDLAQLEAFSVYVLPRGPWAVSALAERAPKLERLWVESNEELMLERLPHSLRNLHLRGRRVVGDPLPESVPTLSLHLFDSDDSEIERLLAKVKSVTRLILQGTPAGDELVEALLGRWSLKFVNLRDTRVTSGCMRRIKARYPKLRMQPKPDIE